MESKICIIAACMWLALVVFHIWEIVQCRKRLLAGIVRKIKAARDAEHCEDGSLAKWKSLNDLLEDIDQ